MQTTHETKLNVFTTIEQKKNETLQFIGKKKDREKKEKKMNQIVLSWMVSSCAANELNFERTFKGIIEICKMSSMIWNYAFSVVLCITGT